MRKLIVLCLVLSALPSFAARVAADLTVPAAGTVILRDRDLSYVTELTITNHRDARQRIDIFWIDASGLAHEPQSIVLHPNQTLFGAGVHESRYYVIPDGLGAMRFVAVTDDHAPDPAGQIEVSAFVIAQRGRHGSAGQSRQEIAAIPSSEYFTKEMQFIDVRHKLPTYTNVGIVNLDANEPQTFLVWPPAAERPIEVTVAARSTAQVRLPGTGNDSRVVSVVPMWAHDDERIAVPRPWVAYTSTIDGFTGDAFSGTRVPAGTRLTP
jgi:hypothetical protein